MEENGSVGRKVYSKRAKTAKTLENIKRMKKKLEHSPHRPSGRLEKDTGISRYTVRTIFNDESHQITFVQDGAPPHHAAMVRAWLQEAFNGSVINRTFEDFWPPYSPDHNPCDFFLLGYLKSVVYEDTVPATLEELKKNIRREVRRIKPETLRKVYDNVLVKPKRVLARNGA